MSYIDELAAELIAGHPTTGAYNANNALAAGELNAINRPAESGVEQMVLYLATHDNRTNEGEDTVASALLGRLRAVADAEPWSDVFGRGGVWVAGASAANNITLNAAANTITFGSNHVITAFDSDSMLRLRGTRSDDGYHQVVSVASQVVTVDSITTGELLEAGAARVYDVRTADLITVEQKHAAAMFITLIGGNIATIRFDGTELDDFYTGMESAGVWKTADSTALQALSENQQSRAQELAFPTVREGHVAEARA